MLPAPRVIEIGAPVTVSITERFALTSAICAVLMPAMFTVTVAEPAVRESRLPMPFTPLLIVKVPVIPLSASLP